MEKKDESKEIVKQLSKHDKLRHFLSRHPNEKSKKGYSFKIVYLAIIAIFVFLTVLELPEILTILSGAKVNIPVLSTIEFKDKLNIWLTFDITVFTLVGSYSTYMQVVLGQEKGKLDDMRNELEKLYGPVYSILNNVVYKTLRKCILTQSEKLLVDEKMSPLPHVFVSQEEWKLKIITRRIRKTGDFDVPKDIIESFISEYEKKKEQDTVETRFGDVYSIFKNCPEETEDVGILLPDEKMTIDKKFSNYPYMLNKELYDYWNKHVRTLEMTIAWEATKDVFTLMENPRAKSQETTTNTGHGVYRVPKTFIKKFLEEYDKRIREYLG